MSIRNVALVGANGILGQAMLNACLLETSFTVTVISRLSSTSVFPSQVRIIYISENASPNKLINALRGQDAIITTLPGMLSDLQMRFADAAAQAGVKRFIPADFGSCDSSDTRSLDLLPLFREKKKVRTHLQDLASRTSLSWTSLVCGHFFDFGMKCALLQFDLGSRRARIFDGGDIKWSTSTRDTIAMATVEALKKEDETKNQILYIESFSVTQNQLLSLLEAKTGHPWTVEHVSSAEYMAALKERLEHNPNNEDAIFNLVSAEGIVNANWGSRGLANILLGLRPGDLNAEVDKVLGL